jgi:hypothetical protein
MTAPNQLLVPASSDNHRSDSKLHDFKKVSKRVVLAMRFMSQTHSDAENEPSINQRLNVADVPVRCKSMFLGSFSSMIFVIFVCFFQDGGFHLVKDFSSHPLQCHYLQGLAFEEAGNFSQARDFYELAREGPTQHPTACAKLWDFYQFGRPGITRNFDRAYSCAKSGALLLCAHCSGALSLHKAFGWGMSVHDVASGLEKIDVIEALLLAKASSHYGSAYGHYALATLYFGGVGVAQNVKETFSLYSKAAQQGLGRAKVAMGACYKDGIGVQVNLRLAAKCFDAASNLGIEGAAFLSQNVRDQMNN